MIFEFHEKSYVAEQAMDPGLWATAGRRWNVNKPILLMMYLIATFHQSANFHIFTSLLGPVVTTNYLYSGWWHDRLKADRLLKQEFDEDGIVIIRLYMNLIQPGHLD